MNVNQTGCVSVVAKRVLICSFWFIEGLAQSSALRENSVARVRSKHFTIVGCPSVEPSTSLTKASLSLQLPLCAVAARYIVALELTLFVCELSLRTVAI